MVRMRHFAIAGASVLSFVTAAHAADLPPPLPPAPQLVRAPIEEVASGWYLRGDVGYRFNQIGAVTTITPPNPTGNTLNDPVFLGLGAGYKSAWLRTDLTLDYAFKSNFRGNTPGFTPDYTMKVEVFTALANAYLDLGSWYGFTPYVGAGVGGAYVMTSNFASASLPATSTDGNRWNLAWAGMAGISYCFTPNLLFDIGYRYLDVGRVTSGVDSLGNQLSIKDLSSHEVRAGLRWQL